MMRICDCKTCSCGRGHSDYGYRSRSRTDPLRMLMRLERWQELRDIAKKKKEEEKKKKGKEMPKVSFADALMLMVIAGIPVGFFGLNILLTVAVWYKDFLNSVLK